MATVRSWCQARSLLGAARRALSLSASAPQALRAGRPPAILATLLRLPHFAARSSSPAAASGAPGGGLLRQMSTGASEKVAGSDGSDDPYLPYRIDFENAKAYVRENVKEGMSRDDVAGVYCEKLTLHDKSTRALTLQIFCQRLSSEPWSSTFPRPRRSRCSVNCCAVPVPRGVHPQRLSGIRAGQLHARAWVALFTRQALPGIFPPCGRYSAPSDSVAARSRSCGWRRRLGKGWRSRHD